MHKTYKGQALSIIEARRQLAELVSQVAYQGQEFIITRYGKPMAKLVAVEETLEVKPDPEPAKLATHAKPMPKAEQHQPLKRPLTAEEEHARLFPNGPPGR